MSEFRGRDWEKRDILWKQEVKVPREVLFQQLKDLYENKVNLARSKITGPLTKKQYDGLILTHADIKSAHKEGKCVHPQTFTTRFSSLAYACHLAGLPNKYVEEE